VPNKYKEEDLYMIGRKDIYYDYPVFDSAFRSPMNFETAKKVLKIENRSYSEYKLYRVSIEEV